jgi:hypothetical protein
MGIKDDWDEELPDRADTGRLSDSEAFWSILIWSAIGLAAVLLYAAFAPPTYR